MLSYSVTDTNFILYCLFLPLEDVTPILDVDREVLRVVCENEGSVDDFKDVVSEAAVDCERFWLGNVEIKSSDVFDWEVALVDVIWLVATKHRRIWIDENYFERQILPVIFVGYNEEDDISDCSFDVCTVWVVAEWSKVNRWHFPFNFQ